MKKKKGRRAYDKESLHKGTFRETAQKSKQDLRKRGIIEASTAKNAKKYGGKKKKTHKKQKHNYELKSLRKKGNRHKGKRKIL